MPWEQNSSRSYCNTVAEPEHIERLLLRSISSVSNDSHIFAEDAWYKTLTLDGGAVKFKFDTGADVSVITEETWRQLNPRPHVKAVQTKLMTPSGPLLSSGQFTARSGGTHFRVIVASTAAENLLDRTTTVWMGFIKGVAEITFAHLFADIGLVACEPMKIVIRDDAQPYSVVTLQYIPIPMEAAVWIELGRMEHLGIIQKISEPTQWCSPMLLVIKKYGKVRICVDLKCLNASMQWENFTSTFRLKSFH